MTTDEVYLLVAETCCAHGRLTLEDAERTGDDWTVYLRDAAHSCPYAVRDYRAYQTHAPALPADWIVWHPRAARYSHDYGTAPGALTLPELALLLADAPDAPAWRLYAIHRTGPVTTGARAVYLIELIDPTTAEVRAAPTLAAYQHLHAAAPVA